MSSIQNMTDRAVKVWETIELMLTSRDWTKGNIQFPVLVTEVVQAMSAKDEEINDIDILVRFFIHNHPDFCSVKGKNGGVTQTATRQAKVAAKVKAKAEVEADVAAKVAAAVSTDQVAAA